MAARKTPETGPKNRFSGRFAPPSARPGLNESPRRPLVGTVSKCAPIVVCDNADTARPHGAAGHT